MFVVTLMHSILSYSHESYVRLLAQMEETIFARSHKPNTHDDCNGRPCNEDDQSHEMSSKAQSYRPSSRKLNAQNNLNFYRG